MNGISTRAAALCLLATALCGSIACIPGLVPLEEREELALAALWRPGRVFDGTVGPHEAVALYTLGAGRRGDAYRVAIDAGQRLNVALFDDGMNLLARRTLHAGEALEHTLRRDCGDLRVAVSPSDDAAAGFQVEARRSWAPRQFATTRQRLQLNFAGAAGVVIHGEPIPAFAAFDAARIGAAYADATDTVRAAIVATLRRNFAGYGIDIHVSGDLPPAWPYATIHFGGNHDALLGLADHVDRYNGDHGDAAIVFTDAMSRYAHMGLGPRELGEMIGNVAAHEVGHLLGLYHTAAPGHLMDVTGGVFDLLGARRLDAAPLDPAVFPAGVEDAHAVLSAAVGYDALRAATLLADLPVAKPAVTPLVALGRNVPLPACGLCAGGECH